MERPIPVPPPPPGVRGPSGPGPNPNFRPGPGGIPPPPANLRPPGPPPPGPGFQIPIRNSTRIVDVTTRTPLTEEDCKKRLTTYEAHTIRKIPPRDPKKEKATWARSELNKENFALEEVSKQVKKLNESRRSVSDKKQALQPFQQKQVNNLLDDLNSGETDTNFEWSLAQLDQKIKSLKNGQRETSIITCYVKRSPRREINPVGIYNALERQKAERFHMMNKPPPQPQQGGGGGGNPPPGVIKLDKDDHGDRHGDRDRRDHSRIPRPRRRSNRRYHHGDDSSSRSSIFDSDTESSSGYSSENTSMDSVSDRHQWKYNNLKGRRRSHSRVREHKRQYYINDTPYSPEPRIRDSFGGGPVPTYVPEVPRGISSVPPFDPVTAAYQAGKVDADADRFGLDRAPRVRPSAVDRAIVSYPRLESRYVPEPRYERVSDPRYIDDFDDLRYREGEVRRRDAEEYIERVSEPYHRRRVSEPRVIYTNPNPFVPRRYAPSLDSDESWPFRR